MGERTSYPPGTFSWVENATTDQHGAKSFYAQLLGWEYDDNPVGDDVVYSMAKLGDKFVAAISPQMGDEREQGVPPHWNNYVTVEDVDAVAGRVTALGGQLLAPPFDVLDVGRMAVLMDPTGAVLCLWQPRRHIGAGLVNVPGALTWNELATRDPDTAKTFYGELFRWGFESVGEGVPYWVIRNGDRSNGGIRLIGDELPAEVPAHWLPYFVVEDVDAALEKVTANGGQVLAPKMSVTETGSFAAVRDPAGAVFAIYEGHVDD
jgi:uncharacterized protein